MADIQRLEDRIDDLVELTTLSLLENATESLTVIDSAGNERTKAGFLADNFKSYAFSDFTRDEYRAVVVEQNGVLSPQVVTNEIRMIYDSDASTTTRGSQSGPSGEIVTLPIDSSFTYIDQSLATETENINPFAVLTGKGVIQLSPASDTWVERRRAPEILVDGGTVVNTRRVVIPFSSPNPPFDGIGQQQFGALEGTDQGAF